MSLLYLEVTFKSPDFVLTTILSSSIVSAFITFLLNKKQKQDDFKTEYKKFIVEKRKAAYNKLEEIISIYSKSNIVKTLHGRYYGQVIFHQKSSSAIPVVSFINKLTETNEYWFWYSLEMQGCLSKVAKFLHESVIKFDYIINDEDETQLLFKEHEKHRKKISKQFFKDVLNLQDVEKFKISKISAIG